MRFARESSGMKISFSCSQKPISDILGAITSPFAFYHKGCAFEQEIGRRDVCKDAQGAGILDLCGRRFLSRMSQMALLSDIPISTTIHPYRSNGCH
jgi:hypothetical protein